MLPSASDLLNSILFELNIQSVVYSSEREIINIINEVFEEIKEDSYEEGRTDGYKDGDSDGYDRGYDAGVYAEQGL